METPVNRLLPPVVVFAAATLSFGVAHAVIMGWVSMPDPGDIARAIQSRGEVSAPTPARCGRCGVIESVRAAGITGNPRHIGAAAGGNAGAATERPLGGGFHTDLLTVIGAVFGAMAGNRHPREVVASGAHEITVRFEDGSSRVLTARGPLAWKTGDRVKIIGSRIQPDT